MLRRTLSSGALGDDVTRLQRRLADLKFNPGPIDGQFGTLTEAAVWAYEKLVLGVPREAVTGDVTPRMWRAMQNPVPIAARRPDAGRHTEIYLPEQVLVAFDGNTPLFISHVSTGDGAGVGRGGDDQPGRVRQRDRYRAADPDGAGALADARRGVQL